VHVIARLAWCREESDDEFVDPGEIGNGVPASAQEVCERHLGASRDHPSRCDLGHGVHPHGNRSILDGNKHTAFAAADLHLRINGLRHSGPQREAMTSIDSIFHHQVEASVITNWLSNTSPPL